MTREKYESLPLATLKELAKARKMKGVSTLKKADLIEAMISLDEQEDQEDDGGDHGDRDDHERPTGGEDVHGTNPLPCRCPSTVSGGPHRLVP